MVSYLAGKIERAWSTPTKWYPIPIALGALVLVVVQYRKQRRATEPEVVSQREGGAVVKPAIDGPWQVSTTTWNSAPGTCGRREPKPPARRVV